MSCDASIGVDPVMHLEAALGPVRLALRESEASSTAAETMDSPKLVD